MSDLIPLESFTGLSDESIVSTFTGAEGTLAPNTIFVRNRGISRKSGV